MGLFDKIFVNGLERALANHEAKHKRKDFSPTSTSKKGIKFIKTFGFLNSSAVGRDKPAAPEYDFEEIKRAAETDSYIKMSLDKYKRMVFKAGYYLKSNNNAATDYLWQRFKVMDYATRKPIDILFQEVADDMITYSNCFIVKTRSKETFPGINAKGLFDMDPIVGYSRIDPSTIQIVRDDHGNILRYEQKVASGKEKKYKPEDVIHMYMDKESSNAFGTPQIIAALEDVKVLRRLEGNILAMIHRFAMPIFQWKIGLPQVGFQASEKEIEEARYELEHMSLDGTLITNEKTEIRAIGAEGNALNASEYLKYFEQRVITALNTSASAMGRGGAKQDADSMESQAHDYVKYVQKNISIFIENYMLYELLLEGGFNPILNKEDEVFYTFNETSLETKIKVENHEMLKYQSNLQTLEEARRNIGYDEEIDESRLYKNLIEVPAQTEIVQATADAQGEWSVDIAKIGAAAKAASGKTTATNGKKKSQTPNKAASSRNRPSNQHGTTSVKVKEGLDLTEKVIRDKGKHLKKYSSFYRKLEILKKNLSETDSDLDILVSITMDSLKQEMSKLIYEASEEGKKLAIKDLKEMGADLSKVGQVVISLDRFSESSASNIKDIFKDIKERLDDKREFTQIESVINALEYRFRFMIEYILPKTVWYSYLMIGKSADIKTAEVKFGNSKDAEKYDSVVKLNSFSLDDIPAFHPFCDCKLKFNK